MPTRSITIGMRLPDVSDATLRFCQQIGVEAVALAPSFTTEVTGRPLVPPAGDSIPRLQPAPWKLEELRRLMARVESFGLIAQQMPLPLSGNILMGRPERDDDLEAVKQCVRSAGQAGLPVLTYSFTALRASEGYGARRGAGRGGAHLRDFEFARVRDLPSFEGIGCHSLEQMWDNLAHFLREIVPVAEQAGVRLAAHPNDPPVPEFRGVAQPLADLAQLERLVGLVDSPSNAVFLDTGVVTELGQDAVAAIRAFGERDRIAAVHFRNVRVQVPRYRYLETFIDEGEADMPACMCAFHQVGYQGMIDPDHTPGIPFDTVDSRMGWAFAVGYIIGLRDAVLRDEER